MPFPHRFKRGWLAVALLAASGECLAQTVSFPATGISVTPAAGWTRVADADYDSVCVFEKRSEKGETTGRIEVVGASSDLLANAKRGKQPPINIAGTQAWPVAWSMGDGKPSSTAYVFERGTWTFVIAGHASGGDAELRAMIESVAAVDRVAPAAALTPTTVPHRLLRTSQLVFSPPDPVRPFTHITANNQVCFILTDGSSPDDNSLEVWVEKLTKVKTRDDMVEAYSRWVATIKPDQANVKYTTVKGKQVADVLISQPIQAPNDAGRVKTIIAVLARDVGDEAACLKVMCPPAMEETAKQVAQMIAVSIRKDAAAFAR